MFSRILKSKSMQNRVRWILAVVMIPPFAFFFHLWAGGRGPAGPGGNAGVLFGHAVPWNEFQDEYAWLRRNAAAQFGKLPEGLEPYFRQQAWERLMLKAEARKRVKIADAEVADRIAEQPAFQRDGRFSRELYNDLLRGLGLSPAAFEDRMRDDLRIEKLLQKVKDDVRLTDEEAAQAYRDDHQMTKASVVAVDDASFTDQAERALTDQDLRAEYAAHPERVQQPAQRVIEYLERPLADALQDPAPITGEDLQSYYDSHPDDYKKDDGTAKPFEEVRTAVEQHLRAHRVQQQMTDLASDLEEDLGNGLRFVEIALSRGLMAKRIGPVQRGQSSGSDGPTASMVGAAFDVPVGQMTQVFNTPIGVFLLMPVEETPAHVPPFGEVRRQIKDRLVKERAHKAANERAQELRVQLLAKQQAGQGAADAYKSVHVEPKRPAPFTRKGPIEGIEGSAEAAKTLSKAPVGALSDIIPTDKGFVIGFVEERPPVDEKKLAAEKDAFRQTLLEARKQEHVTAWLDALRERAKLKSFVD